MSGKEGNNKYSLIKSCSEIGREGRNVACTLVKVHTQAKDRGWVGGRIGINNVEISLEGFANGKLTKSIWLYSQIEDKGFEFFKLNQIPLGFEFFKLNQAPPG